MWQGAGHAGLAGLRPWWLVPCSRAFMGPSCPVQSIQAPELLLSCPALLPVAATTSGPPHCDRSLHCCVCLSRARAVALARFTSGWQG